MHNSTQDTIPYGLDNALVQYQAFRVSLIDPHDYRGR